MTEFVPRALVLAALPGLLLTPAVSAAASGGGFAGPRLVAGGWGGGGAGVSGGAESVLTAGGGAAWVSAGTFPAPSGPGGYGGADSDWRQNGADEGRSGFQPLTADLTAGTVGRLYRTWTAGPPTLGAQTGGAVIIDGTVFRSLEGVDADLSDKSGQIRRYDAASGADLGPIVTAPGRALGQLAAAGDTLLVESLNRPEMHRFLTAYRHDGTQLWEIALPEPISGGFTVGATMILRSAGSTLSAYRIADGSLAWSAPLAGEPGLHAPVLVDGLAVQATEPQPAVEPGPSAAEAFPATEAALPPATPAAIMAPAADPIPPAVSDASSASATPSVSAAPAASAPSAAAATSPAGVGHIQAFDGRTGAPVWTVDANGPELVAANHAVFAVGEGGVCAYAAADGARRWCDTETLEAPVYATVSAVAEPKGGAGAGSDGRDGGVFVVDGHGGLAAFDAGTGAVRWRASYSLRAEVDASYWAPVNGGGVVYAVVYHFAVRGGVATHRVELVAADAGSGELVRRVDLDVDAMVGGEPLLLSGDHVYFAALQKLYALTPSKR